MIETLPQKIDQLQGDRSVRVVGSGTREHKLLQLVLNSPQTGHAEISPGNAGTQDYNVPIGANDIEGQVSSAKNSGIDLVIVGPEDPLALGIREAMEREGIAVFGPTSKEARIESSKWFAIQLMDEAGVPHPHTEPFYDKFAARSYVQNVGFEKIVIKEDGLRGGKGVSVPGSMEEAEDAISVAFSHGSLANPVLIQERVEGVEASFLAVVDGEHIVPLLPSQDYKRIGENDTGPNTGGMGAIAPTPSVDADMRIRIMNEIMYPLVNKMREKGMKYEGILYAGIMIDANGNPTVIEFNCRGGDPEFPVLGTLLTPDFDIIDLADSVRNGTLTADQIKFLENRVAVGIGVASPGYPGKPLIGREIMGLDQELNSDSTILHSGTVMNKDGNYETSGGRVALGIGRGENFAEAYGNARQVVDNIIFDGKQQRNDIGKEYIS